jgi:hypothetical protein
MIEGSQPYSFLETASDYRNKDEMDVFLSRSQVIQKRIGRRRITLWDHEYFKRSQKWGTFLITKPLYVNLIDPPILKNEDIFDIFKKPINTRIPKIIQLKE